MKRVGEVLVVLAAVALLGWLMRPVLPPAATQPPPPTGAPASQPPTPTAGVPASAAAAVWDRSGPPLTFNYLKPGDTVAQAEQRYGPPTFSNPRARFQQWENPLTQVTYDQNRVLVVVEGSGRGVVRQGDRELFRCGEPEEDIEKVFGKPLKVVNLFYHYPGFKLHCGTQQGQRRWVSAVVLGNQEE